MTMKEVLHFIHGYTLLSKKDRVPSLNEKIDSLTKNHDLATLEKDISYYKEYPDDNQIDSLDILIEKIHAEIACIYMCLGGLEKRFISILLYESLASRDLRMYKGLLSQCIQDLKKSTYYFDNIGLKVNTFNTIVDSLNAIVDVCNNAKQLVIKSKNVNLAKVQYYSPKEKEVDIQLQKDCDNYYWGFVSDIKLLQVKIESFNKNHKEDGFQLPENLFDDFLS